MASVASGRGGASAALLSSTVPDTRTSPMAHAERVVARASSSGVRWNMGANLSRPFPFRWPFEVLEQGAALEVATQLVANEVGQQPRGLGCHLQPDGVDQ